MAGAEPSSSMGEKANEAVEQSKNAFLDVKASQGVVDNEVCQWKPSEAATPRTIPRCSRKERARGGCSRGLVRREGSAAFELAV